VIPLDSITVLQCDTTFTDSNAYEVVDFKVTLLLMTKCIKHIRDIFEYALYKFTFYLLTYLLTLLLGSATQTKTIIMKYPIPDMRLPPMPFPTRSLLAPP